MEGKILRNGRLKGVVYLIWLKREKNINNMVL